MKLFRIIYALLVFLTMFSHLAYAEVDRETAVAENQLKSASTVPFALTISGGISLGSYEAGVNWALIEFMKKKVQTNPDAKYLNPDLAALTGASAGSINAAMSAMNWCVDPTKVKLLEASDIESAGNPIDKNLIRDVWLNVGIDELLPVNPLDYSDGQGMPPDALFSRKQAFAKSIEKFKKMLDLPVFKENCQVPVGMLTTREIPPEIDVNKVKVKNQRFVFALKFVTKNGSGHFSSVKVDEEDPDFGTVVYLPGKKRNSFDESDESDEFWLEKDDVVKLLYASSAFPLAFSKVHLSYCASREGVGGSEFCPKGTNLMDANFVDGGVFDNVPLGAARALAEPSPSSGRTENEKLQHDGRRHWFFFINPGNRRGIIEPKQQQLRSTTYGLKGMVSFLPGVLNTLGDYELYTLLRSGKWGRQSHVYSEKVLELLQNHQSHKPTPANNNDTFKISKDIENTIANSELEQAKELAPLLTPEVGCSKNPENFISVTTKKLEHDYLPFQMFENQNRDASVMTTRYLLLGCLADTAAKQRADGLAYSIRQSMLDRFGDRKIFLTSRHFAIIGAYLGHFGAFLDTTFREFDYYSGVYDTVNDMAKFTCQGIKDDESCLSEQSRTIYSTLGIDKSPKGRTVFVLLAKHEHTDYIQGTSPWYWINGETANDQMMEIIFTSLDKAVKSSEESDDDDAKFQKFVKNLHDMHYRDYEDKEHYKESSVMETILDRCNDENITSWYAPTVGRIGKRLQLLQEQESQVDTDTSGWHFFAKVISLGLGKYYGYDDGITGGPSSEPRSDSWLYTILWKLIPYEFDTDLANGGFSAAYMPQLRSGNWSLDLKLTPAGYANFAPGRVGFSQADLYASYHHRPKYFSLGVGPTLNYLWSPVTGYDRENFGVAGYVEMLRSLRFTFGVRTSDLARTNRNNFYIQFGLTDLPGLLSRIFK